MKNHRKLYIQPRPFIFNMPDYQCTMCSYKFVGEKMPMRCPYCSAKGAVTVVQDAQSLLNNADYVEEDIRKIRMSKEY